MSKMKKDEVKKITVKSITEVIDAAGDMTSEFITDSGVFNGSNVLGISATVFYEFEAALDRAIKGVIEKYLVEEKLCPTCNQKLPCPPVPKGKVLGVRIRQNSNGRYFLRKNSDTYPYDRFGMKGTLFKTEAEANSVFKAYHGYDVTATTDYVFEHVYEVKVATPKSVKG